MILKFIREKLVIILCCLVFIFGIGLRLSALSFKNDLHVDETLSILLSNNITCGLADIRPEGWFIVGKKYKEFSLWNDGSLKDAFSDVGHLYLDSRDKPHTNFYYSVLRLAFTGVDKFDIKQTIIRSGILNCFIFSISFFFMFKLLNLFFRKELVPLGLFCAFINPASITAVLLMRPYILQELMFIVFTYVFAKFYIDFKNGEHDFSWKNSCTIAFVIALTLLTGYYAPFFIAPLTGVLIYEAVKLKDDAYKYFLLRTGVLSLVFAVLLYPRYFIGFVSYRAVDCLQISFDFLVNLRLLYQNFFNIYLGSMFSLLLILFLLVVVLKNKLEKNQLLKTLIITAFCWSFFIIYIAPYKELRYIMTMIPIMSLLMVWIISSSKNVLRNSIICIAILIINIICAFGFQMDINLFKKIPYAPRFQYIENHNSEELIFLKEPSKNVYIVYMPRKFFKQKFVVAALLPYFNDSQKYIYISEQNASKIKDSEFYVLVPQLTFEMFKSLAQPFMDNFTPLEISRCTDAFVCFKFKR